MFFDWISPTLHIFNALRGHVTMQGYADEIKRLEQVGISCYAPFFVGDIEGDYLWQVRKADYKRACKILEGGEFTRWMEAHGR